MAGLNSILSGIYSSIGPVRADVGVSVPSRQESQVRPVVAGEDVFEAGQWWKNRAVSRGDSANAYGDQQKSVTPVASGEASPGVAAEGESADAEETSVAPGERLLAGEEAESAASKTTVKGSDGELISKEEIAQLSELKKIDTEVRAHEQAHLAAAGGLAKGGASFSYKRGADGQNYAVGGEVQIDTSRGASSEETLAKMVRVRAAALAPASPSPQDRKVAASASATMSEARLAIKAEKLEKPEGDDGEKVRVAGAPVAAEDGEESGAAVEAKGTPDKAKSGLYAKAISAYQSVAQRQGALNLSV